MEKEQILFELSWEICNKVGGIYTVINSKSNQIKKHYKNYFQIGPMLETSHLDFNELELPTQFTNAKTEIEKTGIKIHYGESKTTKIRTFLIEYLGYSHNINQIKTNLWENYKIDSLNSDWYDYDVPILWGWCSAIAIEHLSNCVEFQDKQVLIHAHEWMSTGSVFYTNLNLNKNKFKTIFTTHATMLGRSLSQNNINLIDEIHTLDPEQYSYQMGVNTKHQTEKAAANSSDCFTTVSLITNQEASFFYSKSADVLLCNGFDNTNIEDIDKLNAKHFKSRKQTNELIRNVFSKIPELDTDKIKLFYSSGRNEFVNKGYDLYIKSLSKLNQTLIQENSEVRIINFFLVPIGDYEKIECDNCNEIPLKTHNIHNHEILTELENNNLLNLPGDKVFNILVPRYLDGNDEVINKPYYDFVSGFDLGVFPSYYEPWGYTPLESISYAVPTITSDLAGFGRHIEKNYGDFNPSVYVLKRSQLNNNRQIDKLYEKLYDQVKLNKKSQALQREFSKITALKYDWESFVNNYLNAYEFALTNGECAKQNIGGETKK